MYVVEAFMLGGRIEDIEYSFNGQRKGKSKARLPGGGRGKELFQIGMGNWMEVRSGWRSEESGSGLIYTLEVRSWYIYHYNQSKRYD